ncbi:PAAR-like domain-containing protein [Azotobacter chroococcum]|nr:PAAR-like domain-containing protein [Azotobacter chroococcum]
MPAHNMGTITFITTGDSAGTLLGVVSNTVMAQSRYVAGSFSVLLKGIPATRLTSPTLQNNNNVPGSRVTPSQNIVQITAP